MSKIKVVIADDSDFVRDGMKIILSVDEEFEVVGCACNGLEAVELARSCHPDIVLMDIQMPVMDGIEATRMISQENLSTVLILTTFDDYDLVKQALRNGAKGYLIKNHTPDQLKQMIKSVTNGAAGIMDEGILQKLIHEEPKEASKSFAKGFAAQLYTARELEIIEAVARGLSNKDIATELFIGEGTVKNYISGILEKEGLAHRTALAVYFLTGKK